MRLHQKIKLWDEVLVFTESRIVRSEHFLICMSYRVIGVIEVIGAGTCMCC